MADCATGILIDLNEEENKKTSVVHVPEVTLPPLTFDIVEASPISEPSAPKVKNIANVEDLLKEDVKLIDAEEFNFDLLMSPGSDRPNDDEEADEEVFFGPVQGFSEICAAASAKAKSESTPEAVKPLSPLNPKQVAELFKEAHTLAFHIENSKTFSPDTKVDELSRKFARAKIGTGLKQPTSKERMVSPSALKSPSADTSITNTSASSHEDRSETDGPPRFTLDNRTPERIITLGSKQAETRVENIKLPKSDLPKSNNGAVKFRGTREGLEGLKSTKVTKTGQRVPTNIIPKPERVIRGGSFRQRPVTSPLKRQRKNSLGSDVETASVRSDLSDSMTSLSGLPSAGKRALRACKQLPQPTNGQRHTGLRIPQTRTRTLSNASSSSSCSTSSQVSNCSQTSSRGLPKPKMQLKATSASSGIKKVPAKALDRKPSAGPVRAKPPSPAVPKPAEKLPSARKAIVKEKENPSSAMKPPDTRTVRRGATASTSSGSSVGSTPQKLEKHLQPKRLLSTGSMVTPKKDLASNAPRTTPNSALTDSALIRRSCLPTPSSAYKPSPSLARVTNTGSQNQTDGSSPVLPNAKRGTGRATPDVSKRSGPRGMHTSHQPPGDGKPPTKPS